MSDMVGFLVNFVPGVLSQPAYHGKLPANKPALLIMIILLVIDLKILRAEFADTSKNATALPAIQNQRAVYNAMMTDFNAMWLTQTEPQAALDAMQAGVERVLRRNR